MLRERKKLAIWKFTSCDGCQLALLDCEDELLGIADVLDIDHFAEASSHLGRGPWDLSLVEGSVTRPEHVEALGEIRKASTLLGTIGACASAGGIQALRNMAGTEAAAAAVYASTEWLGTLLESTPVARHVPVDFELRGCPIDRGQLLDLLAAVVVGRRPSVADHSVCLECKAAGHVCVTVARGLPCLGPVIQAGCGALCPGSGRGCYGCFGPRAGAGTADRSVALADGLARTGHDRDAVGASMDAYRTWAKAGSDHE